ncbi:MAG: hypothetical protein M0Z67_10035 [Nitrospiraceae bacterium]|nr:hypothetical protein [Nitrospiraceae bacterium]
MNKKTATKLLIRKHKDFLKSIDDEEIRKLIDKNSMITGGSIVSLLLNEKVNDYDYYFTDQETCRRVAEYFVKKYNDAHPEGAGKRPGTGARIRPRVEVEEDTGRVRVIVKSQGLAGDKTDGEYQFFESRPSEEGEEFVEGVTAPVESMVSDADDIPAGELEGDGKKEPYRVIFMTSNAITLSNGVQLVIRFYGNPKEIHKNYDFVHCTNYWLSEDQRLYLNQPALEAILSKTLSYVGSLYPIASVIRTRKFLKRGWHINAGQYLKMCFQVSELNLKDINVLDDQLIGVDCAYFYQVIENLKERMIEDPDFKIEMPYLISIIDRIF